MNISTISYLDGFIVTKTLGRGGTGKTKCIKDPATQFHFAAKIFKPSPALTIEKIHSLMENEISAIKKISHKNVIKVITFSYNGTYIQKNTNLIYNCMYILLELCPFGDLFTTISKWGPMSDTFNRYFFKQILEGLQEIHQSGLAHRDIKPENILLNTNFEPVIADFGFAETLEDLPNRKNARTLVGTTNYMGPEKFMFIKCSEDISDVFSLGVVLFVIAFGHPPFTCAQPSNSMYKLLINESEIYWSIIRKNNPCLHISEEFKDLIKRILCKNPQQRLTISEIINHPWINGPTATSEEVLNFYSSKYLGEAFIDMLIE